MPKSDLELTLETHLRQHGLPEAQTEYEFAKCVGRNYRWDACWKEIMLAVEIQGGTYRKGAHSTGTGLARDFEKNNLGVLLGWHILYFDSKMIRSGQAVNFLKDVFERIGTMELEF